MRSGLSNLALVAIRQAGIKSMMELRRNDPNFKPLLVDEAEIVVADYNDAGINFCVKGESSNRFIAYSSAEDALKDYTRIRIARCAI